jgi:hypothetical protein
VILCLCRKIDQRPRRRNRRVDKSKGSSSAMRIKVRHTRYIASFHQQLKASNISLSRKIMIVGFPGAFEALLSAPQAASLLKFAHKYSALVGA